MLCYLSESFAYFHNKTDESVSRGTPWGAAVLFLPLHTVISLWKKETKQEYFLKKRLTMEQKKNTLLHIKPNQNTMYKILAADD